MSTRTWLPAGSFLETSTMFKFITVTLIFAKSTNSNNDNNNTYPKHKHKHEHFKDMPMRVQKISPKSAPSDRPPLSHPLLQRKSRRSAGASKKVSNERGRERRAYVCSYTVTRTCICVYSEHNVLFYILDHNDNSKQKFS